MILSPRIDNVLTFYSCYRCRRRGRMPGRDRDGERERGRERASEERERPALARVTISLVLDSARAPRSTLVRIVLATLVPFSVCGSVRVCVCVGVPTTIP